MSAINWLTEGSGGGL